MKNKTKSVLLFGDSILGRFNRDRDKKLENAVGGITVYNCATGGWTMKDALEKVELVAQMKPDHVILSFPANDTAPDENISVKDSRENLKQIIKAFHGSQIILFLYPSADDRFNDPRYPDFNERLSEYNTVAQDTAKENSVQVIDGLEVYSKVDKEYHMEDGVHFNEYGYEILIQELARLLKSHA